MMNLSLEVSNCLLTVGIDGHDGYPGIEVRGENDDVAIDFREGW